MQAASNSLIYNEGFHELHCEIIRHQTKFKYILLLVSFRKSRIMSMSVDDILDPLA